MEWITVKDRLPDKRCLLLSLSKMIFIGDWYNGIWRIDGATHWEGGRLVSDYNESDITHWMSLPALPTE